MNCAVCGFDERGEQLFETIDPDAKFLDIDVEYTEEFYSGSFTLYACPKCKTLRIK